jgi:hypothetical protein
MIGMLLAFSIMNVVPAVLLAVGFNLVTGNVLALTQVAGLWAIGTAAAVFFLLVAAGVSAIWQGGDDAPVR